MTKRIKKVFSSSQQIPHLWAHQTQDEARSSNLFFKGKSIYSYGYHYELGRLIEYKGKTVALVNTTGYSVTTSKHISMALSATSHLPTVKVRHDFDLEKGLINEQDSLIDSIMSNLNARSFWSDHKFYDSYDKEQIVEFNKKVNLLGFKHLELTIGQDFIDLINEHVEFRKLRQKELNATAEIRRIEQAKKDAVKHAEQIQAWRVDGPFT